MGKGSTTEPPSQPQQFGEGDTGQQDELLAMLQQMMMMSAAAAPAAASLPQVPEIIKPPDVDWTEKYAELSKKMLAEYSLEKRRKIGVMDTIHTSPLLEEEEVLTTGSILTGSEE